ncbi:uncharacterized protein LOC144141509 [Haemaphysalis longicornis]
MDESKQEPLTSSKQEPGSDAKKINSCEENGTIVCDTKENAADSPETILACPQCVRRVKKKNIELHLVRCNSKPQDSPSSNPPSSPVKVEASKTQVTTEPTMATSNA